MILLKSDPKAALPIRAAALLHNQGLEMRLPPTELQGSLPSAWARKFSWRKFSFPCPHLQLRNPSSVPAPRDRFIFMQIQPTGHGALNEGGRKSKVLLSSPSPALLEEQEIQPTNLSSPHKFFLGALSISWPD